MSKHNSARLFLIILATFIYIQPFKVYGFEYPYKLLNELPTHFIIRYSSPQLVHIAEKKNTKIYQVKIESDLSGVIRQPHLTLFCQAPLVTEECSLEGRTSPYLLLRKMEGGFLNKWGLDKYGKEIYAFHPRDGVALREQDEPSIKLFLKQQKKIGTLFRNMKSVTNSYIKASFCGLIVTVDPANKELVPCVSDVLKTRSTDDKVALLRLLNENAEGMKNQSVSLCQTIKQNFNQVHAANINKTELDLLIRLGCPENAKFFLGELYKSKKDSTRLLITSNLPLTGDQTVCKKAEAHFRRHPEQLFSTLIGSLAGCFYVFKQCNYLDQLVGDMGKHPLLNREFLSGDKKETAFDNPDLVAIEEIYVRCKGYQQGKAKQLMGYLENREKNFRVQVAAINAIGIQLKKRFISPEEPKLRENLILIMMNGHRQLTPEIIHLLMKYYPGAETESLLMQKCLSPDAKKYHQSHVIMAMLHAGKREKAIQCAMTSKFKLVRELGQTMSQKK